MTKRKTEKDEDKNLRIELEKELAKKQRVVDGLTANNTSQAKKLAEAGNTIKETRQTIVAHYGTRIASLETEGRTLSERIADLELDKKTAVDKITELKKKLAAAEQKLVNEEQWQKSIQADRVRLGDLVMKFQARVASLEAEVLKERQERQAGLFRMAGLEAEVKRLTVELGKILGNRLYDIVKPPGDGKGCEAGKSGGGSFGNAPHVVATGEKSPAVNGQPTDPETPEGETEWKALEKCTDEMCNICEFGDLCQKLRAEAKVKLAAAEKDAENYRVHLARYGTRIAELETELSKKHTMLHDTTIRWERVVADLRKDLLKATNSWNWYKGQAQKFEAEAKKRRCCFNCGVGTYIKSPPCNTCDKYSNWKPIEDTNKEPEGDQDLSKAKQGDLIQFKDGGKSVYYRIKEVTTGLSFKYEPSAPTNCKYQTPECQTDNCMDCDKCPFDDEAAESCVHQEDDGTCNGSCARKGARK